MIETVFRTDDLPAADRFDYWVDGMRRSHTPVEMHSDHAADYWGHQRVLSLGEVHVWPATYLPVRYRRTPELIRRSDPETYVLALPRRATTGTIAWGDRQAGYGSGEFHVMDSSRPFELRSSNPAGRCAVLGIDIPKALLPRFANERTLAFDRGFPVGEGMGALLTNFVDSLCADSGSLGPADGPRLGSTVTDLVAAMFAHALDDERALDPSSRRRTLTRQIQAFIQRHLTDPDLSPSSIAAAHHISLSYLHELFQDQEATVAACIRRQRLERARRDLADPALMSTPIGAIAARWGYRRQTGFTRAFRAAFGLSPKEHRHQAVRAMRTGRHET